MYLLPPPRSVILLVCSLALLPCLFASWAPPANAAQLQSWTATARIRSGSTTLTDSPAPPSPPGPVDSTGFLEANGIDIVPPAPIDAGAVAEFDLPAGILAVSTAFDATSNFPDDSRIFDPFGGASALYIDDLTITSSTLAPGTPVTVRFVFASAFDANAASTVGLATTRSDISSTAAGFQGITSADNRYLDDLENGLFIQNGLFAPPHAAEYTVASTVGATLSFALAIDCDSFGTVLVTGSPGNETNQESLGWMLAAVAFGGEVLGGDAAIQSGLLGGPFPDAAAVSIEAAEGALPTNPIMLPEPGSLSLLAAGLMGLAALERHRRGRRARPWLPMGSYAVVEWIGSSSSVFATAAKYVSDN